MTKKTKMILVVAAVLSMIAAVAVAVLLIQGSTDQYNKHLKAAQKYLDEMEYEQAIAQLRAAIDIDPKKAEAYLALADIYVERKDYVSAQTVLKEGLREADAQKIEDKIGEINRIVAKTDGDGNGSGGSGDGSNGGGGDGDGSNGSGNGGSGDGSNGGNGGNGDGSNGSGNGGSGDGSNDGNGGNGDGSNGSGNGGSGDGGNDGGGRTLTVEEIEGARVGDIVIFGSYEQDNNLANGKEPIEWYVLENDGEQVTLLSVCVLDATLYGLNYDDVRMENWENCTFRSRLNHEFYQEAFTEQEQDRIAVTHVVNGYDALSGMDGGNDTEDKVWLLSYEEIERYFGIPMTRETNPFYNGEIYDWDTYALYCYELDHRIIGKATAYAQARYCATTSYEEIYPSHAIGGGCWLLRSPSDFGVNAHVYGDGAVLWYGGFGMVEGSDNGIRPAIKLAY